MLTVKEQELLKSEKKILKGLNPQQAEAVRYFESPLLILAGAGSGKTRVITHKIAYMIDVLSFEPERILAVTFTNRAAREMAERVERLTGKGERVNVSTFHSFCVKVLKSHSVRIGFKPNFLIVDSDDRKNLIKNIVKELNLDPSLYSHTAIASAISSFKNGTLKEIHPELEGIIEVYNRKLKEMNAFDFDDLLIYTWKLLTEHEDIRERYSRFFRYVLIDEYQDTNKVQYEIARALTGERGNICAVGDEDQCIYTWRGATIRNILDFERDFPDAKVIKLEKNYRCSATILEAANSVISKNRLRKGKRLFTDNVRGEPIRFFAAQTDVEEARYVSRAISKLLKEGFNPSDIAVFYRTNFQSRVLEDSLRREGIDYQIVGGVKFFERKEVKDILAYLRFSLFPEDQISLFRIVNTPKRGIGQSTVERIKELTEKGLSGRQALKELLKSTGGKRGEGLKAFVELIEAIEEKVRTLPPYQMVRFIYSVTNYEEYLRKEFPEDWESRAENVKELGNSLAEFAERERLEGEELLLEFLNSVSLRQDQDEIEDGGRVTLMTVHSSKGLEFPAVFITGLEEGLFPHQRSLDEDNVEEERRLFYVAITRAKRFLSLSYSKRRRAFGSYRDTKASRFLKEVPRDLLKPVSKRREETKINRIKLVFHRKFGKGVVRRVEGKGDDAKVTAIFAGYGEKTILKRFLKVLG